eukprot:CAMPEP_0170192720 /NCGR_PEP_ID=MMETSP0040_2-20121228/55020_1 /TAXON_ID=641309 /ORGANISM="Lotharella oceanica, Strain CCMP622" /LENGTH=195 /DNA_ID=CAMNT_0010441161 /DNA_START=281 /DNA_END=868 /DNA_ORIENTATION=+
MVVADSNKRSADKLFQELKNSGANVISMGGQFSLEKDYQRLVQETVKAFGTIDVIILDKKTKEAGVWAKSYEVDIFGVFYRANPIADSLEEKKLKELDEPSEKVAQESAMKRFMDREQSEFKVGDSVIMRGLTKVEVMHLNGKKGTISSPSKEGYYRVKMEDGKSLDVRPGHLQQEARRVKALNINVLFLDSPEQ